MQEFPKKTFRTQAGPFLVVAELSPVLGFNLSVRILNPQPLPPSALGAFGIR